jgi:hypothetical protein
MGYQLKPGQLSKTMGYDKHVFYPFWEEEARPSQSLTMKTGQEIPDQINASLR